MTNFYPGAEDDAINLLKHGLSVPEIASEIACGCSEDIVRSWIKSYDLRLAKAAVNRGFTRTGTTRNSVSKAELDAMTSIYCVSRVLSRESGEPYEVDHIIEVQDGGQHVLENLRIVPRHMNRRGYPKKEI